MVKKVLSHVWKHRQTTALGVAGLASVAFRAYVNPVSLAHPETIAQVISSVGLIVAADPGKGGAK